MGRYGKIVPPHLIFIPMKPIVRSELVWVKIPAGTGQGASIPFTDQPTLNGVYITGVEAFTANEFALTPDRIPVVPTASAIEVAVTFNEGSDERHRHVPYESLNAIRNAGVWHEFEPFRMDWQKSRVHWYGPAPGPEDDIAAVFLFHYVRPEDSRY